MPLLVAAAVAGPEHELGAVRGVEAGVIEALAGGRADQLPVLRLPLLVGAAVAGPPLDQGAVGGLGTGDVHAAAVDLQGPVACHGPVLRGGVAVAVPHLHLVARGAAAVVVVHALGTVVTSHDRPGHRAGERVADGVDVGLDRVVGGVRRVAGGHDPLEEVTGRAVAVVAADPEDDGSFLMHGDVATLGGQRSAIPGGQPARVRVAAFDRIRAGAVVLHHGGDEGGLVARVVRVIAIAAAEQAVLQVRLHPWAAPIARREPAQGAEVDRVHVTVAVVTVVRLGVAVVEAASAVDVRGAGDHVGTLRRRPGRHPGGGIVAVSHPRGHIDPVDPVATGHHRQGSGVRADIRAARPAGRA